MWFHSHSTCPHCRKPVQPDIPAPAAETPVEVVIPVSEPPETEVQSITGLYPGCHHYENETSRTLHVFFFLFLLQHRRNQRL
uniref:Uncharacterized protein n=1 Tax=Nelumbo nucifera TaxID=4432 RepID=A0A822Z8B6_NELNU|nr:TPA_asm: hypothetical protein HUJ06_008379 [Nelumbo nucifera]